MCFYKGSLSHPTSYQRKSNQKCHLSNTRQHTFLSIIKTQKNQNQVRDSLWNKAVRGKLGELYSYQISGQLIIKTIEGILESALSMLYCHQFCGIILGQREREKDGHVCKCKRRCPLHPPPTLHFFSLLSPFIGVSFSPCVQRKLSPFHSAWQTESSEDKKPFLA